MASEPRTWGDLLAAMRRAIDEGDTLRGEALVEQMQREAGLSGDLGQEASALFYEGMFAEATGQLARAEICFQEVVAIDRRLYGPVHDAVADALNSLALVQGRMGKMEAAAEAREQCAAIYVETGSPHGSSSLVQAAQAMLRVGRLEDAERLAEEALEHPPTPDAPWHVYAAIALHRAFVPQKRFRDSLAVLAEASREPLRPDPAWREAKARVWCDLGHTSVVFALRTQCAFAYQAAQALTKNDALRAEAQKGLDHVGARFDRTLDAFRVVHVDPAHRLAHVAHLVRGFFLAEDVDLDAMPLSIGDAVEIDADRSPTSILRVHLV